MIIKGTLQYDQHGRRRKTVRTKRKTTKSKWKSIGAVAQSGERRLCTAKVESSNLSSSTNSGKGTKVDNSWKLEISKKYTIAPAYNKGAYQVIPREDVEHIGK
tara:strand:- start:30 stop:338 length:309 start_codon:yes stop_codon:yes gene_type:complete